MGEESTMAKKRLTNGNEALPPSGSGVGVDVFGGPVIDPTKNVLDLVRAESRYQDAMREADGRLALVRTEAETRRVNDLAALRLTYDTRIAENLRVEVKTTSEQLAAQLVKETGSLSQQISALTASFSNQITTLTASFSNQISALTNALTPRIADLERFRWEQGGKTSVSDPATSEALTKMAKAVEGLIVAKEQREGGATAHAQTQMTIGQMVNAGSMLFVGLTVIISALALILHR